VKRKSIKSMLSMLTSWEKILDMKLNKNTESKIKSDINFYVSHIEYNAF
jgi:hypothetical protein